MRLTVGLLSVLALASCQNDYGQFAFGVADGAAPDGAQPDAPVTPDGAPVTCKSGELLCDGRCVSRDHREHCGSCGNDCTALGLGAGFVCSNGACGCGLPSRCGEQPGADCTSAGGVCECGGVTCRRGEACTGSGADQECSCNGEGGCADGQTCCPSPKGCSDEPC